MEVDVLISSEYYWDRLQRSPSIGHPLDPTPHSDQCQWSLAILNQECQVLGSQLPTTNEMAPRRAKHIWASRSTHLQGSSGSQRHQVRSSAGTPSRPIINDIQWWKGHKHDLIPHWSATLTDCTDATIVSRTWTSLLPLAILCSTWVCTRGLHLTVSHATVQSEMNLYVHSSCLF